MCVCVCVGGWGGGWGWGGAADPANLNDSSDRGVHRLQVVRAGIQAGIGIARACWLVSRCAGSHIHSFWSRCLASEDPHQLKHGRPSRRLLLVGKVRGTPQLEPGIPCTGEKQARKPNGRLGCNTSAARKLLACDSGAACLGACTPCLASKEGLALAESWLVHPNPL